MHKNITTPPHECESADTFSATLTVNGLDVNVCGFDRTPETKAKVERLTRGLSAMFAIMEDEP